MTAPRQMHLGVFVLGTGNHIAGWRWPGAAQSFEDLSVVQEIARIAERGKFDLIFLGDNLATDPGMHPSFAARFEPLTMLAALAATTTHVGLGATSSTTYNEPYTVARQFASLDHLSGGRAAWNAVTSSGDKAALNYGRQHPAHDARYEIAEEFVDVVRGLWDCWDDGAVVRDHATGRYIDPAKVKPLNHEGRFFKVKGPLPTSRCPQGQPIILQAGSSEPGLNLAARTADVVFAVVQDLGEAQAGYQALKSRMPGFGRSPDEIAVLPGVMPVLGSTAAEARERLNRLQSFVNPTNALGMLSTRLGHDVSGYPLDALVPRDLPLPDTSHGFARTMLSKAWRENMTWRDMFNLAGAARGHWVLAGTPEEVADTLQLWFEAEACDGFNVLPAWFPGAFDEFVDQVVPILQRRGLYRRDYTGNTLRDHLGLPRPRSRLFAD
ncbi:LLM class flavin-dependent oxidoreductase [Paracraurococcus ruber]|uniref:Nitrilotriacetate monooxygenase n=1 Tax=Paracraurococcus ruber TaxID=77675 RepID=A0ABS1CSP6_9PROT|nr:LLM class flavin-dependent oxidoreductase [Paracraurococcus ruber]MBK1657495.1 nitrilotriacetate monooxygenase [Paracraurococcus ruber]TDG30780.1 LLM class flavin-dependent oxidoreductase [Paracraurococcus ruber]